MQLTRLIIENIRAIKALEIDLSAAPGLPRRRRILLGANGSGKTTVVDAIAHAFQMLARDKDLRGRLLGAGDVRAGAPVLDGAELPPHHGTIRLEGVLVDEERRRIRPFFPELTPAGSVDFLIGAEPVGGGAMTAFGDAARAALAEGPPPCVLLHADRGTLRANTYLQPSVFGRSAARRSCLSSGRLRFNSVAAQLALAFGGGPQDPEGRVARMWKVLDRYVPDLPRPVDVDGLTLHFKNGDGSVVPLRALSHGERALMLLFGELALRDPREGVVLIDEIEQHLHPRWQREALAALTSLLPDAQYIITTQAPYLAACAPDDVFKIGDWKRHGE